MITGKALAKEMKQSGYSLEDNLYDVENGMREVLGEIGKAGLAEFLAEILRQNPLSGRHGPGENPAEHGSR